MSRKTKPVILGPDGRPYVAPPKKREPAKTTVSVGGVDVSADVKDHTFSFLSTGSLYGMFGLSEPHSTGTKKAKANPLGSAIAEQVGALVADFDGVGGLELPRPEPDLHTYADAFESARKKCKHPNPEDTTHSRSEFYCHDCQRYFGVEEYRRTRSGLGGWFGL